MIMHAARSVDEALTRKWEKMAKDGVDESRGQEQGLQILFLDGEEAFDEWTATDSLYGARCVPLLNLGTSVCPTLQSIPASSQEAGTDNTQ